MLKQTEEENSTPLYSAPKAPKNKIKAEVYAIIKGNLILRDNKGNQYRIYITKEYKNTKIGDTVYL